MSRKLWVATGLAVISVAGAALFLLPFPDNKASLRISSAEQRRNSMDSPQTPQHDDLMNPSENVSDDASDAPPVMSVSDRWKISVRERNLDAMRLIESEVIAHPEESTTWLRSVLEGTGPLTDMQEFAADLLARIGTPVAVNAILSRYEGLVLAGQDADNVRAVLDHVSNPESASHLLAYAAECSDTRLFESIVQAVARSADKAMLDDVCDGIANSSDSRMRFVSESIVRHVPPQRVAEHFQAMVGAVTNTTSLRFIAARLGDDGSQSSIDALTSAARSAQGENRTMLLDGIFRISALDALPRLEAIVVGNADYDVRKFAVYAMANYPLTTVAPVLDRLLTNSRVADVQKEVRYVQGLLQKQNLSAKSAGR
jgi:hypothetical protein